jgi:predicted transposase/invertase (TIGR01784 family)
MEPEQFLAYESRLKRIMDEEAAKRHFELMVEEGVERGMKEGKEKGMREGRKEGLKEGEKMAAEQIAERLLAAGNDTRFVAEMTGLAEERVLEIRERIEK